MMFGLSNTEIERITEVFLSINEVERAIMYGSRAKGNYRRGSDIDIALAGKNLNEQILNKINFKLDDLLMPYLFDLCLLKQLKNEELIDHIHRVGKTLYEKQEKVLS